MALRIGEGVVRITPDLGNFGQLVQRDVTNAFDRIGRQAQNLGSAFLPLSLAMGGILAASGNLAVQFQDDFVKIQALVGETREALDKMVPTVKNLATETGRRATELSDALYFVESSGIRGTRALEVLDAAAKAAAVGLGDASQVADTLTSAVNAYARSGLTAEAATDVLVATVREGKIETDALGTVIGRVIPVAAQLGVSFDQVGAAVASMSKVGLSAEESTTALRQTLVTLLKPSAEARNQLEAYGLSAEGLRRQIREEGLLSVLNTLNTTFGDNQEALNRVFQNVRALTGVLSLVGENAEQVQAVFKTLADSTGDLNTAFDITQKSARFQLDRAFASLQVAAIDLGETFVPVIRSIAESVADLAQTFSRLPDPVKNFIATALTIGAISAPLLLVVGSLARTAGALAEVRTAQLLAAQATKAHAAAATELTGALAAQTGAATASTANVSRGRIGALLLGPVGSGSKSAAGAIGKAAAVFFATQVATTYIDTLKKEGEDRRNEILEKIREFVRSIGTGTSIGVAAGGLVGAAGGPVGSLVGGLAGAIAGAIVVPIKKALFDAGTQGAEALIEGFDRDTFAVQRTAFEYGIEAGIGFSRGIQANAPTVGEAFGSLLEEIKIRQKDFLKTFADLATTQAGIFENEFADVKDVSFKTVSEIAKANADATTEIEGVVSTLRERGLTGLATQLAENVGPEALAAARAIKTQLLSDPDSVFNLEADVQRLGGNLREQFLKFLEQPETGGLPTGLLDRLDEQARSAVEDGLVAFGAELGRERPDLADQLALSVEGSVRAGLINGIAQAFATLNPEDVLPTEELLPVLQQVFSGDNFENLITQALLAANQGQPFQIKIPGSSLTFEFDPTDISPQLEQALGRATRGLPLNFVGPLPPLTIEEKVALTGLDIDLTSLAEDVASSLTTFADTNLPDILSNIDFARGDITFQEALLQGLSGAAAQITAEELGQRLHLGTTFGDAVVADIQANGPALGEKVVNEIIERVERQRRIDSTEIKRPFQGLGEDAISGILEGLDSGARKYRLNAEIRAIMQGLEDNAREVAGAESPAKKYAALGRDIVNGLRQGIARSSVPDIPLPGVETAAEVSSRINQVVVQFVNPKHQDPVLDSERILGVLRTGELIR